MFPVEFADTVVEALTKPGDRLLDPFAGRATSLFSAVVRGRHAAGVEINPVGWVYGRAKLNPAPWTAVEARISEVARLARDADDDICKNLPEFFKYCYARGVLKFLVTSRRMLNWRSDPADWTTMAFILIYLHGKRNHNLSNQMRQSKAMAPDYAIKWWKRHRLKAPERDPEAFLLQRVRWRYRRGVPDTSKAKSALILGDSSKVLPTLATNGPFDILFTSPPYYAVANYYYDQWLRLWMLGESPFPRGQRDPHRGKFDNEEIYEALLEDVFQEAAEIMKPSGIAYVRTDAREFTLTTTIESLRLAFPRWEMMELQRPFPRKTQTALFGDTKKKPGEVDVILCRDSTRLRRIKRYLLAPV